MQKDHFKQLTAPSNRGLFKKLTVDEAAFIRAILKWLVKKDGNTFSNNVDKGKQNR